MNVENCRSGIGEHTYIEGVWNWGTYLHWGLEEIGELCQLWAGKNAETNEFPGNGCVQVWLININLICWIWNHYFFDGYILTHIDRLSRLERFQNGLLAVVLSQVETVFCHVLGLGWSGTARFHYLFHSSPLQHQISKLPQCQSQMWSAQSDDNPNRIPGMI